MAKKIEVKEVKKTPVAKKTATVSKPVSKKDAKPVKELPAAKKEKKADIKLKPEPKKKDVLKKNTSTKTVEKKNEKIVLEKAAPVKQTKKDVSPKPAPKTEKKIESVKTEKKADEPKKIVKQEEKPITKEKKVKLYSKKDLEEFKKVILEKRNEIIEQLQALKEQMMDPTTGQYVNENSPYSLHMAEQGTDSQEREKLYLWAQRENKFLGYLEEALSRIDTGTYGLCLECIDEPKNLCPTCPLIPKERLMAVPHTQMCVQVKKIQDTKK